MKLPELIDKLVEIQNSANRELSVVVRTYDYSIGPSSTNPIENVYAGFDWNNGKVIIYTKDKLIKQKEGDNG